ncbi:hypothetical protein BGZ67_000209, partial [Mortierella alpina]
MKAIPSETTKLAMQLLQEGFSVRQAAQRRKISKSTAGKIYHDNKENMPVNKGGRPRKISAQTVEHLK